MKKAICLVIPADVDDFAVPKRKSEINSDKSPLWDAPAYASFSYKKKPEWLDFKISFVEP